MHKTMFVVDLGTILVIITLFLIYDFKRFPAVLVISWLMFAWHYIEKKLHTAHGGDYDSYPGFSIFPHLGFSLIALIACIDNGSYYLLNLRGINLLHHHALFFQIVGVVVFIIGIVFRYFSFLKEKLKYNMHLFINYWGFYMITIGMASVLLSFYSLLAVHLFVLPALFIQGRRF